MTGNPYQSPAAEQNIHHEQMCRSQFYQWAVGFVVATATAGGVLLLMLAWLKFLGRPGPHDVLFFCITAIGTGGILGAITYELLLAALTDQSNKLG